MTMSNTPATVRVVATDPASQGGFVVINAADFDPELHQRYDEAAAAAEAATDAAAEAAPRRGRKPAAPAADTNTEGA